MSAGHTQLSQVTTHCKGKDPAMLSEASYWGGGGGGGGGGARGGTTPGNHRPQFGMKRTNK